MRTSARVKPVFVLLCLLLAAFALSATGNDGSGSLAPAASASGVRGARAVDADVTGQGGAANAERRSTASPITSASDVPAPAGGLATAEGEGGTSSTNGELTLHSLTAWDAPGDGPSVYLSFTPISLEEFFGGVPFVKKVLAGEEIEVADCAPELTSSLVDVAIDGAATAVTSLDWYYAGYGDLSGTDTKYMPVCVMRIDRPRLGEGEHRIDVRVRDARSGAVGAGSTTFVSQAASDRL